MAALSVSNSKSKPKGLLNILGKVVTSEYFLYDL